MEGTGGAMADLDSNRKGTLSSSTCFVGVSILNRISDRNECACLDKYTQERQRKEVVRDPKYLTRAQEAIY